MNFALDEEQERLRATARAFLADCSSSPQVRSAMDSPLGWDPAVWRRIAAELRRYGITANAFAPAARTRMTEEVFATMMAKPASGFDAMDPANVSPLVAWLGSAASTDVTGHMFEVSGGKISLAEGWHTGPEVDRGARWNPADVGAAVCELLGRAKPAQKVYGT